MASQLGDYSLQPEIKTHWPQNVISGALASVATLWELVGNADYRSHPKSTESETLDVELSSLCS